MVRTLVSCTEYFVTIDAFDGEGDLKFTHRTESMTFTSAADYFTQAVAYFKFAMLDHADWTAVQVEINSPQQVVELAEIKK